MSTALHIAKPTDLPKLMPLVMGFQTELGISREETAVERAVIPMLEGSPYGVIYLMGPARAPIGYLALTFSWSLEFGGMIGTIDEFFVRPAIRGRGIGTEVLSELAKTIGSADVKALFLDVDEADEKSIRLYSKAHFQPRTRFKTMVRQLAS